MCNLYSYTKPQDAARKLARVARDITGNMPPLPAIFPDQMAPVVRTAPDGVRELVMMRWGFPPPPRAAPRPVTNVRHTHSSFWRPWLQAGHRCLVPVTSFCEYDHRGGGAVPTWFAIDETRPPFCFAGIWRPWEGIRGTKAARVEGDHLLFSFLTTEANALMAPVHEKAMPVVLLDETERETWLSGSIEDALALQRPAAEAALRIVAVDTKQDAGT
jgi:putative SOS response-associated peptidase YedK